MLSRLAVIHSIKHVARLPFRAALDYLRNSLKLPSASWTDIWHEQHTRAFVIAGAMHDGLLEDMYGALVNARQSGRGLREFRQAFEKIAGRYGWGYRGTADWRARIIYDTNITQAHNAGRWQQMQELSDTHPYLQYQHSHRAINPRQEHLAWDGLTLARDDPWWATHYPANGWGCKCRVRALTRRQMKQLGKDKPDDAPPIDWQMRKVGTKGASRRTVRVPKGIDAGFAYNVGGAFLKPHVVPPLVGYDAVLALRAKDKLTDVAKMPPPRTTTADAILPSDIEPEKAAELFLTAFGADLNTRRVFTDAQGSPIVVGPELFQFADGDYKWLRTDKAGRMRYTMLLAETLLKPQEIWWRWEADKINPKRWRLKRRYLANYQIEDRSEYAIVAFEWGRQGWTGSTAFPTSGSSGKRLGYWKSYRLGKLVWANNE